MPKSKVKPHLKSQSEIERMLFSLSMQFPNYYYPKESNNAQVKDFFPPLRLTIL